MALLDKLKQQARQLKRESVALYFAARHERTPWYAKLFVSGIVAYALSPIDLIPDFIPVLGFLDELIVLPVFISVAMRLIPDPVLQECRARADALEEKPVSIAGAMAIVVIWLAAASLVAAWFL
jgi:uncharacterized membrane protein YkvA (DUF1232 family)